MMGHQSMAICKTSLELWWPGKKLAQVMSLLRVLFNYEHFLSTILPPILEQEQLLKDNVHHVIVMSTLDRRKINSLKGLARDVMCFRISYRCSDHIYQSIYQDLKRKHPANMRKQKV